MAKTKKWIIWLAVIALVIGGGVFYAKSKKPQTAYTTADVAKGTLAQTVSVTGDLVADEEITLNFEIGGRVDKVFVKESDQVAAGDRIATLTDAILSKQVEQAKALLDQAIAAAGSGDDTLREAEVALDSAKDTLKGTDELNKQNIAAAGQAVRSAEKLLEDTQAFYDSAPSVANKLTLTNAENGLEAAKQALKTIEEQADLARTNAKNAVDGAKARVETAQSDFARDARDAQVAGARAAYELAQANLAKAALISPVNGIITEVNNKPGEVLGTGVIKESFSRVMSLDMIIQSQVPESDIVKIKKGQKAKVTFDALTSEDEFEAEIIEIDPAATVVQDVVNYEIKLKIFSADARLKPGMSANVDIATAEKKDVLMIPLRAVKAENSQKFVDVLKTDNTTERRKIETGLEGDEGLVEVRSGLKEGEKAVTFVSQK